MRTSLQLFCIFAVLGTFVSAQNLDFAFKSTTFPVEPKVILRSNNVPNGGVLSSSTVLLPGPVSGTNTLLSVYSQNGKFTLFRQILNVFTGQVIQSFNPITTSMPLNDIKYTASYDGYLAFASVENDDNNINQVFVYKMFLNGTKIQRMAITSNSDNTLFYKVLSIFNDNKIIGIAYSRGINNGVNFVPDAVLMNQLTFFDNDLGFEFLVTAGNVDSAFCDSIPYSGTAYCIFKQGSAVKGATITLTYYYSQAPVVLFADIPSVTYAPLYVAALNGYYVTLSSAKSNNQYSLVATMVAGTFGPKTINKWTISNDFVSFAISSVVPYYNGFAIFYSITDSQNNQFWYYEAFTKDFDVATSASLIATVPNTYLFSSFSVASTSIGGSPLDPYLKNVVKPVNTDFGNPIGLLAVQSTGTQTLAAWYGQIIKESYSSTVTLAGSYISPFLLLASFILGLILIC